MDTGRGEITETLLALEAERKTGALDFRAEGVLTRIFIDRGVPVFAEAGVLGETLGHVLLREQIITSAHFGAVVRKMTDAIVDNENVRFGEVLVELGILSQDELTNALATQIEKKIIGCVHRGVGDWSFDSSRDVKEVAQHAAPVRALLVDAARALPEARTEALLKLGTETFPCTIASASKIADDYGLEDAEVGALDQFDGTRTTESILSLPGTIDQSALLCALVMGGAVELLRERGAKVPPSTTSPVNVTGRHRAVRIRSTTDSLIPPRLEPLPAARNDREATLFAEDEFQTGKRLFLQGNLAEAHAQLKLAVERSPQIALYQLYEEFVGSRSTGKFVDAVATKKLAVQLVKEDAECAFAYYVLGYLSLDEGANDAANRFFKRAHKLDPELLDAGRQARLLDMQPAKTQGGHPARRTNTLSIVLAVILVVLIGLTVLVVVTFDL